jgi:hypothetical protein
MAAATHFAMVGIAAHVAREPLSGDGVVLKNVGIPQGQVEFLAGSNAAGMKWKTGGRLGSKLISMSYLIK